MTVIDVTDMILPTHAEDGELYKPRALWYALIAVATVFLCSLYVSIAVNSIALGLMGIVWLLIMIVQRRKLIVGTPLDYYFLAFVCTEMLSTLFSVNREQSLFFSRRVLLIGVVYFFASVVTSERIAKWYVGVLLGSASVVAALGIGKVILTNPERLGIFQFYMTTSELMMMSALLVAPFVLHSAAPRRVRLLSAAGLLLLLIALYATVTRGAYLAVAAGMLFIAFVRNKKLIVPVLALLVLIVLFAPPFVQSRIKSIVDLSHPENAGRLMLWEAGLKIFAEHPIVGVGDIDLHEELLRHIPREQLHWGHLHNVPLQFLVNFGIVGFIVVMALFVKIFVTEWRVYQRVKENWLAGSFSLGALALFVGFQTNGLVEWSFGDQEVVLVFWTSLGLTLALGRIAEKKSM